MQTGKKPEYLMYSGGGLTGYAANSFKKVRLLYVNLLRAGFRER